MKDPFYSCCCCELPFLYMSDMLEFLICVLLKYTRTLVHAMSDDPLKKQSVYSIFLSFNLPFSSKDLHAFKLRKKV